MTSTTRITMMWNNVCVLCVCVRMTIVIYNCGYHPIDVTTVWLCYDRYSYYLSASVLFGKMKRIHFSTSHCVEVEAPRTTLAHSVEMCLFHVVEIVVAVATMTFINFTWATLSLLCRSNPDSVRLTEKLVLYTQHFMVYMPFTKHIITNNTTV